jgi:hypothetical protein
MKVKIFEVILHKLPSGKSPATALDEQLNGFLGERPQLRLMATHMSTLVSPAQPGKAGGPTPQPAGLENYRWQSHCHGLFELPIAA